MSQLAGQIVELGQAQSDAIVKISSAMQKISLETQHLAAGAEQSSSTTAELSVLAEELNATLVSIR
jgi:methyl-accepting chemotaxis protein